MTETDWKPLPMVTPTSFEISPKGPYIITTACDEQWPGTTYRYAYVSQVARTLDDPRDLDIYCDRVGPHYITTGFAPKTGVTLYNAWVSLGWHVNILPGFDFEFWVEDGTFDFLAIANEKVFARRGIAISGDMALPPFDLNLEGTHAPRHNITVLNAAPTDTITLATTDWFTRDGYLYLHNTTTLSTPFTVAPVSMLMPDDVQVLSALTMSGQSWREIRRTYHEGDSRELRLPDYVDSFTWSHVDGAPEMTWTELPAHDQIRARIWGSAVVAGQLTYSYQQLSLSRSFEKVMGVSSLALDSDIPGYRPQWRVDLSRYTTYDAFVQRDNGNDTSNVGIEVSINVPMMPIDAPDPRDIERRSAAWRLRRAMTHGPD